MLDQLNRSLIDDSKKDAIYREYYNDDRQQIGLNQVLKELN